jgi:putative ABC transport system permease protein
MFACLLLSASYIKRELSYDRHNANADRIVRLTAQFDNDPIDGRLWGNDFAGQLEQMPEIESVVRVYDTYTAMLSFEGKSMAIRNAYAVSSNFLQVFDLTLLKGEKENAMKHGGQVLFSESFARQLFGNIDNEDLHNSMITIDGQKFGDTVFVSGIFKDMPETSHFKTNILLFLPDEGNVFAYTYLLIKDKTDIAALEEKINNLVTIKWMSESDREKRFLLTPLTDIHLHSHNLREMSINGNINYIYLVIGANALLFIVVLFNLWLNASLIFAHNRRHYQLLRLHGMPATEVLKNETLLALLLGFISILMGFLVATEVSFSKDFILHISLFEIVAMSICYLLLIVLVSLIPVLKSLSLTRFLITDNIKPVRFSYSNVKYMLMA